MKGIARTHREQGRSQKQAPGLTQDDETIIVHEVGTSSRVKDVRDLAMLLTGRALLSRASELVSITIDAIEFDEEDCTAFINLRRSKGNTDAEPLFIGQDATEALRRWLHWLNGSGVTCGPVFVGLTKGGKLTGLPLTRRDVGRVLKSLARRSGLTASFSAHSLRVGMAQDLVAEGYETAGIMQAAGWSSPAMLARYTRKLTGKRGVMAKRDAKRHK
jgi:site-specific recombinase XerD